MIYIHIYIYIYIYSIYYIYIIYIYIIYIYISGIQSKPIFKIFRQMPSSVSLQMSLIYIYKVKSATLLKLLMGNVHNKLNII